VTAPKEINRLIERFQENRDVYCSSQYNEAQARIEFIDPLLKALGWDMTNEKGYAEAYKEVIHEDAIKVGGATKAPDYAFRIGGVRKFFVEAKRPGLNIKEDSDAAYQLRRYAWSAKLPLSVVTDFEEFAVYDCRIKPAKTDKPSLGRVLYLTVDQYNERWDEIAQIFSQDAILTGSFDKYVQSAKKKRGTAEVDTAFLKEIEGWRDVLARNIALRNAQLSTRELNYAVQRTIDRIIFLRICEDRGIEQYGQLMALQNGTNTYQRLCQIFRRADERYNSGLFHFTTEKDRLDPPDNLTLNLTIDDNLIKGIIKGLYYPESPFEFSVLPADILGHIYEQFLGKVIRLTAGHHAKVEDKPEVKKAGGVYYTPTYIVDYIVKNTVGKLLEQNTPAKVSSLRILDPACGSGSFLLGAYQTLLDWHQEWYAKHDPEKHAKGRSPKVYLGPGGEWRLTTPEKKRILLNNIYGVDIDTQAVEVTKLSLLLKVLEGENAETLGKNLRLFHERALPDLGDNIKCGNSLIGPDFYEGRQISLLDEEERYRINAFDWNTEFPHIMNAGGFDAVIGNPPYLDVKQLDDAVKDILRSRYEAASRRFDLFVPFVEKGLTLLDKDGLLGFILPSMFAQREYGTGLRRVVSKNASVVHVVDFGSNRVFQGPMNYVAIYIFCRDMRRNPIKVIRFDKHGQSSQTIQSALAGQIMRGIAMFDASPETFAGSKPWRLASEFEKRLFAKATEVGVPLASLVAYASEGIHSGKDPVFYLPTREALELRLESPPVFSLVKGKDVHRYNLVQEQQLSMKVVYPYDLSSGNVLSEDQLKAAFPHVWEYLVCSRSRLRGRSYFDRSSKKWYELWCPRKPELFLSPKIIGPEIAGRGEFTLARDPLFFNNKVKGLVLKEDSQLTLEPLLGLLNSRLLHYLHRLLAPPKSGGFFEVKTRTMGEMPIVHPSTAKDEYFQRLENLVINMLRLHRNLHDARTAHDKKFIQRQIDATDKQIDQLVYELYGLTNEEIRIVEEATG